jgi:hypothetical protein
MTSNRKRLITITAALTFGLFSLAGGARAQSNCKEVKGQLLDVFTAGAFSGTITNAGDLDGTSAETFTGSAPTPVPTVLSFRADFALTTHEGQLKASWVNLFDNATGLYINGKAVSFAPFTVAAELTGQICYAKL